jgi:hypothetical protein
MTEMEEVNSCSLTTIINKDTINKDTINKDTNSKDTNNKDNDECNELKNITYKNRMMAKNNKTTDNNSKASNLTSSKQATKNISNIEEFLDKERIINKGEPWNKLDKTEKIKQINDYINHIIIPMHALAEREVEELKLYLSTCLDRKKLLCVKDVLYDKILNRINSIPCLHFNTITRKFTLKRNEKRICTTTSLGKGQQTKKNKEKC